VILHDSGGLEGWDWLSEPQALLVARSPPHTTICRTKDTTSRVGTKTSTCCVIVQNGAPSMRFSSRSAPAASLVSTGFTLRSKITSGFGSTSAVARFNQGEESTLTHENDKCVVD